MRNEYQSLSVPWGDVHRIQRGSRSEPFGGGATGEPIFFSSDFRLESGRWTANYGYGFAMVVKFGDLPEAVSMVPFGASEKPGTRHYDDQLNLLLERRFKRTYYRQEEVISHAVSGFGRVVAHEPGGLAGHFVIRTPMPVASRLSVALDPPGPLPDGLSAFTLFSTPQDLPIGLPVQIDGELHVAPELCDPKDLPSLAPYAFDETDGWQPVTAFELNAKTATFTLRDDKPRTYAIFGPTRALKTAVQPQQTIPAPMRSDEAESPSALFKIAKELPSGRASDEPGRVAWRSGGPMIPSQQDSVSSLPATPEVVKAPASPQAPAVPMAVPEAPPPDAQNQTTGGPASPAEASPGNVTTSPEPMPADASPPKPAEGVLRIDKAAIEQRAQNPQPPKPAPEKESTEAAEIKLKAVGPPGNGKVINLRTPDGQDLFLLEANTTIEARLVVLAGTPGPLPEGMAVFTEYVGLERIPKDARAKLTLKLTVPESACSADALDQLKLYGYRVGKGWYEAPGQKVLKDSRAITAFDDVGRDLRVYAVLGPIAARKAR